MKKGFSKWDIQDHLTSRDSLILYLLAVLEERHFEPEFVDVIIRDVKEAHERLKKGDPCQTL